MIIEYRDPEAQKKPGRWFTFTYSNGIRATLAEYQSTRVEELEELGRELSRKKRREIRMRVHDGRSDRIHAIFHYRSRNRLRGDPADSSYNRGGKT